MSKNIWNFSTNNMQTKYHPDETVSGGGHFINGLVVTVSGGIVIFAFVLLIQALSSP